jgi:hypothetical protein
MESSQPRKHERFVISILASLQTKHMLTKCRLVCVQQQPHRCERTNEHNPRNSCQWRHAHRVLQGLRLIDGPDLTSATHTPYPQPRSRIHFGSEFTPLPPAVPSRPCVAAALAQSALRHAQRGLSKLYSLRPLLIVAGEVGTGIKVGGQRPEHP